MSARWLGLAFNAPNPKQPTERLLFLALCDVANEDGICWPSNKFLQRKIGLTTKRGLQSVMRRLVKGGFVTRYTHSDTDRPDVTKAMTNVFQLHHPEGMNDGSWGDERPDAIVMNDGSPPVLIKTELSKNGTPKPPVDIPDLPSSVDADLFAEFVDSRERMKSGWTPVAHRNIILKLHRFHDEGINSNLAIRNTLEGGWKSINEPKDRPSNQNRTPAESFEQVSRGVDAAFDR